jgi:class 3 adenylate cyclase
MPNLPTGTVTFVFSDIEGSTALMKELGDEAYTQLLAIHRRLVRETFAPRNGQEIDTQGDAFFYSFVRAREAVSAAVDAQRSHADQAWPHDATVRMRLGLHTGEPAVGDEGYTGLDVVRAARIAAVGRGGQVLLSDSTRAIVAGDLPEGVELRSLGERQLKDIDRPEPIHELLIAGVEISREPIPAVPATTAAALGSPAPTGPPIELPAWIREAAAPFLPFADRTREAIEERVLAELRDAMRARDDRAAARSVPAPQAPSTPPAALSVADEVAKLQSLRESGALNDEQYAKAVDRLLSPDG